MKKHMTGTREEWLTARLELLKDEKKLTGAVIRWCGGDRELSQVVVVAAPPRG